jgi:hypothetical protein
MGDAACHLQSVCLSCGRFVEAVGPAGRCPHCGAATDGSGLTGDDGDNDLEEEQP